MVIVGAEAQAVAVAWQVYAITHSALDLGYTGLALPKGSKLWSKAGWTSTTRHDAAYIETPEGGKFVLVTFTTDHANDREIIPTVARIVLEGMNGLH